jgi:hypothetical protein
MSFARSYERREQLTQPAAALPLVRRLPAACSRRHPPCQPSLRRQLLQPHLRPACRHHHHAKHL